MRVSVSTVAILVLASLLAIASAAFAQAPAPGRVIVKLKPGAKLLESGTDVTSVDVARERAWVVGKRLGIRLAAGARISERAQVVVAENLSSEALAALLARDPDVEYAVPDRVRRAFAAPNDPLYPPGIGGTGPAVGQWYLRAPAGEAISSIDAERAWSTTQGNLSIVVAVLDTGVRFDHPDLGFAANGGSLLPGFDMIASPERASDGDGRDLDASDPGDSVTDGDVQGVPGCSQDDVRNSSWHGTAVSGLIAALTDNGVGMASVGRGARVLPVRVLGKCGGFDSDVIAGMRWAVGLFVPGVPLNTTPARVLNLSLGGDHACNAAYQSAVSDVLATGAVIVASAGNSAGHAVGAPGNCNGVIAVGALRHVGTKVGFSDLGPAVAISAPGGNCVNVAPGAACLYPILTTHNRGTTAPEEHSYSDSFRITVGTSFSAPLVSGTVALMLSARPSLSPTEVRTMLQATARPFPTSSPDPTLPACRPPQFDAQGTPIDQLECLCSTATCGAGMLDTGAAVLAAQQGVVTANVVEYYHDALDHYFITWRSDEIALLDAGIDIRGWRRTGQSFRTYITPAAGSSAVCRYYIPPAFGNSHFFGRSPQECAETAIKFPQFQLEDLRFMYLFLPSTGACPAATTPIYRVFSNRPDANHRYLTDRALRDTMVARGWLAEGEGPDRVVMCAPG